MLKRSNLYIGMSVLAMMVGPTAVGRAAAAQESHGPAATGTHQEPQPTAAPAPTPGRRPRRVNTALRPRISIP